MVVGWKILASSFPSFGGTPCNREGPYSFEIEHDELMMISLTMISPGHFRLSNAEAA
jgi:hypothetical protein